MNTQKLIKSAKKPEIYTQGTANMWVDEYISTQLLEIHLSQDVELASRKASTITSTVEWVLGKVPGDRLNILDMGCGPGLYKEKVRLRQHIIMDDTGEMEVYRFWMHTFSHSDLDQVVSSAGFNTVSCYDNVIPDSDLCRGKDVTFCIGTK